MKPSGSGLAGQIPYGVRKAAWIAAGVLIAAVAVIVIASPLGGQISADGDAPLADSEVTSDSSADSAPEKADPDYSRVQVNKSSNAYKVVRSLYRAGLISEYGAVRPKRGWGTEYDLDHGGGYIRTRTTKSNSYTDKQIEYGVDPSIEDRPQELMNAITRRTKKMGYKDVS